MLFAYCTVQALTPSFMPYGTSNFGAHSSDCCVWRVVVRTRVLGMRRREAGAGRSARARHVEDTRLESLEACPLCLIRVTSANRFRYMYSLLGYFISDVITSLNIELPMRSEKRLTNQIETTVKTLKTLICLRTKYPQTLKTLKSRKSKIALSQ